ncbi:YybH family protein [Nocardia sp. NPDC050175]|uniref:YybH family protein n=1 Tax=Nocardia sp. NPDC050175 TaxID=3364317 RepID=UPI0037A871CC
MSVAPETDSILRTVLDEWKAAVDNHDPDRVAATFTEDAIFQGLHPYTVGHAGIAAYYESQPEGMKADYRVLESRRQAGNVIYAYLAVVFAFTDRPALEVNLGVTVGQIASRWYITTYQVSQPN